MVTIHQLGFAIDECSSIEELQNLLSVVSDLRCTVDGILLKAYNRAGELTNSPALPVCSQE